MIGIEANGPAGRARRGLSRRSWRRSSVSARQVELAAHLTPADNPQDLLELFVLLGRAKRSLCRTVDRRLRTDHGISFEAFYAMTVISESRQGFDMSTSADAFAIEPNELHGLMEGLVRSGRVQWSRGSAEDQAVLPTLKLTLRGCRLLKQATGTVEDELAGSIRLDLSPEAIEQVESSLAAMWGAVRSQA